MFVRCSHANVSTFSAMVSATGAIFSPNPSRDRAMFVRRRRYVLESLQVAMTTPLRFENLRAMLQQRVEQLPDCRQGRNTAKFVHPAKKVK